ncbi:hypothetical protein [Paraburkholderia sacchari]|uniref:hypothetical protein n=1 Tax=Paraburkholderia sacchari TaxID=159450 RepID=UPI001BCFB0EE|nr:hypothetical protein [Paraburkholderia sacchari]
MNPYSLLLIADWAHPSWLDKTSPVRSERARAAASVQLLNRYPQLAGVGATPLPWFAAPLARPACARLMRLCGALASARTLRLVVASSAREQFSRATGLPSIAQFQRHARGDRPDLRLDTPIDCFSRHALTTAGLALALRATSSAPERLWLQLRLPRQYGQTAVQWRLPAVSQQDALKLIEDALDLLHARRTSC